MYYVIPLGGIGERFKIAGYTKPKPLVKVMGKEIIYWLLDLMVDNIDDDDEIIIIYNPELEQYNFSDLLHDRYDNKKVIHLYKLTCKTAGAAETLYRFSIQALNLGLNPNSPVLCLDGDNTYNDATIMHLFKKYSGKNFVILAGVSPDTAPVYSYARIENDLIVDIVEKNPISNFVCTGGYGFESLDLLRKYTELLIGDENLKQKGEFYTSGVYKLMLKDNNWVYPVIIDFNDFICFGTPLQVRSFCNNYPVIRANDNKRALEVLRVCFDLDNTLVTYCKTIGDYSTVSPIIKNIQYARYLKRLGHIIIIYTARNMKIQNSNIGKILSNIGKITMDTITKFDIPCDELYFGKPYAHVYIDDLAINPYDNDIEKMLGIYQEKVDTRSFNILEQRTIDIYRKNGCPKVLRGEIHWYNSIPNNIKDMFPLFFEYDIEGYSWYDMEKIKGKIVSYYLVNDSYFKFKNILDAIINSIIRLHNCDIPDDDINIYSCYKSKLILRYNEFDYVKWLGTEAKDFYDILLKDLTIYEENKLGSVGIIHGDPVCTNILINQYGKVKFIDMRGIQGKDLTIVGDKLYDWAKLFQSLCGYDHILFDKKYDYDKFSNIKIYFLQIFREIYDDSYTKWLHVITASLLFTLIPLHKPELSYKYFQLSKDVYEYC